MQSELAAGHEPDPQCLCDKCEAYYYDRAEDDREAQADEPPDRSRFALFANHGATVRAHWRTCELCRTADAPGDRCLVGSKLECEASMLMSLCFSPSISSSVGNP